MFQSAATNFSRTFGKGFGRRTQQFSTIALRKATTDATHYASTTMLVVATTASVAVASHVTFNHCQIPCGIFSDPAMVDRVKQDCQTIRKAMVQSSSLWGEKKEVQSMNQVVRWIKTKDEHCDSIIKTMADYCLCQRVKRSNFKSEDEYLQALKSHHVVMQAAMKAKQTMDTKACDELEHAVEDMAKMYS
jgi:hypothetical protein